MQVRGNAARQDTEAAAKATKEAEAAQANRDAEAAAMMARETEARYPEWRVMLDGVRMRSEADLGSLLIDGVDLPVGFEVEQIAAVQNVGGVERVKIRDRSGKEGWVTPDARPKGGQVFFKKVDTGADGVRRFMQFKRRGDGTDSRCLAATFSPPRIPGRKCVFSSGVHFHTRTFDD